MPDAPTALDRLAWAMNAPIDDATAWRALVVLADRANETGLAWPKIDWLRDRVRRGERQTRAALDVLEEGGYIERLRLRAGGRLRGYLYRVLVPGAVGVDPDTLPAFAVGVDLPPHWHDPVTSGGNPPVESAPDAVPSGGNPPVEPSLLGDTTGEEPPLGYRRKSAGQDPLIERSGEQEPKTVKPSPDGDRGFEEFWQVYPQRNGKRVGKKATRERWRKMSLEERRDAYRAAVNYRAACDRGQTIAKDPERFIAPTHRYWEDWLTPPEAARNGDRPGATDADYRDAFARLGASR